MTGHPRPWLASYDAQVPQSLAYEDIPVFAFLDRAAAAHPRRDALRFHGAAISYAELARRAEVLAAGLRGLGVRRGDRVAILLPNLPQMVVAYWGVLKAGATAVMVNPLSMEKELVHQFTDSGARAVILLDALWAKLAPLRGRIPAQAYIVTSVADALPFPKNYLYAFNAWRTGEAPNVPYDGRAVHRWRSLLAGRRRFSCPDIQPGRDLALLQYTGGTTGSPKGCMIPHASLAANCRQCASILHSIGERHEVFLAVMPFFHIYGLTVCLNFPTAIGATLLPAPRFSPKDILATIHRERPSIFPGAPAIYIALMHQREFRTTDFSSLRYCVSGSAPMPVEVLAEFTRRTGAELIEGYGLTEASPVTHLNPIRGRRKAGSIGLPFPDTDCRIVDPADPDADVPPGSPGELLIRGPQVMAGYWNRPEETARTLRGGWLLTGDIAEMDDDGYFRIVDRKKDLIIMGGYNVYPREVEEVLYEHPGVKEAVVVGVPHPTRGETVKAFVVRKEGSEVDGRELIALCRQRLAAYKAPRVVEFREQLPKTAIGKLLRRALRDEETARAAAGPKGGAAGEGEA